MTNDFGRRVQLGAGEVACNATRGCYITPARADTSARLARAAHTLAL